MKKILIFIILTLALFGLTYAGDGQNYELEISIGNNGTVYLDKKIPISIEITNNSDDFDGYVKVLLPLESNNQEENYYSYDYIMQIAAGESKKIESLESIDPTLEQGDVRVQLVSKNGKVNYEEKFKIRKSYDIKTTVAILSDDFDSLSYIKSSETYDLVNLKNINLDIENVFSLYDVIFINYYETSKLSKLAIKSLEKFVNDGGDLVIGTGQYLDKSLEKLDFIGDVEIDGLSEVSSVELQNITGVKINNESTMTISNVIAKDYESINALAFKKQIASGSLVITKVSLGDDAFKSYFGSDSFIDKIVEFESGTVTDKHSNNNEYYIENYISKIPKKFMPKPGLLVIFMFIFVIIVGPATYIVLNHLDKRDYGFIVIIAIVIISITMIKGYGYTLNSNSDIVNHLSFLTADGDSFNVNSYIGFKGSKGDVDVAFSKDNEIVRFARNNYNIDSRYVYSKYTDEFNHIVFHDSKQWEFNKLRVTGKEKFDSKLVSPIKVNANNLKFDFKNELGFDITEMFLIYGDRIFYKSELLKGDSFNFDKDISAMYKSTGPNVAKSLYGYGSVLGLTDNYLKNDIVSSFFNSMSSEEAGAFLLIASEDYSVEIKTEKTMKEQKLAYIYIPLDIEYEKGISAKVSEYVVRAKVIDFSGIERNDYNGNYDGNGFITFEYKIASSVSIDSFEFEQYISSADMFYEIYNVKAGIWENIDTQNFVVTGDKVANYYNDGVKVKVTTTGYTNFESPKFSFEGVGK